MIEGGRSSALAPYVQLVKAFSRGSGFANEEEEGASDGEAASTWSWGWVLALVAIALGTPATAEAGSYTFTLIADTSGAFTHLDSPPAINASGTVVFTADLASDSPCAAWVA